VLTADRLTYATSGRTLLDGVSFELAAGELLAVVGPNGAGKSTLLKLLSGDLAPTSGRVAIDGRPLDAFSGRQQAQRRAVLPQASSLAFPFRVHEVVLMGRTPHARGVPRREDHDVAHEALVHAGAERFADREYPTLSGGEKQRVQLARVLAQIWEPPAGGSRYLFLDEPTNNLDLGHQHHTLRVARTFAKEGTAVVAVLHDLNLAAQYADRMLLLHRGRPHALGAPEEVLTPDALAVTFGVPVVIVPHPCFDCPLVVSAAGAGASEPGTAAGDEGPYRPQAPS
jgi:iron complex transport system ATP-binding protein